MPKQKRNRERNEINMWDIETSAKEEGSRLFFGYQFTIGFDQVLPDCFSCKPTPHSLSHEGPWGDLVIWSMRSHKLDYCQEHLITFRVWPWRHFFVWLLFWMQAINGWIVGDLLKRWNKLKTCYDQDGLLENNWGWRSEGRWVSGRWKSKTMGVGISVDRYFHSMLDRPVNHWDKQAVKSTYT